MTDNKTSVSDLMGTALVLARQQQSSTTKAWVGASFLVGGLLPKSMIMASVQRIGELDVMLRCMEEEAQADMKRVQANMWTMNLPFMLARVWVCELYEVFRLLKSRELVVGSEAFDLLTNDLRALRVAISKHEIAADRRLSGPILMKPEGADNADAYEYRTGDPQRAHIMAMGLSARGSVMWQAIDGTSVGSPRWLEKRSLSERTLQLLSDDGSLSSQE